MKQPIMIGMVCIVLLVATVGHAKFYKYRDQNGTTIFTDDLSQVPKDQRPEVKTFESIISPKVAPVLPRTSQNAKPESGPQGNDLEAMKEWILKEQDSLNREKEALAASKKAVNIPNDQDAYNERVKVLNIRIDAYKKKLSLYRKTLETQKQD